jgi:excisionase family DNA binding protein
MSDQLLYRLRDAAPKVGLGMTKLREEIAAGRIETVRVGNRSVLIPHEALVAYVELLRAEADAVRQRPRFNVVEGTIE